MFITGIGTAVPPRQYAQAQCWDEASKLEQFQHLSPRARAIIKKVLRGNNGIATRHLALNSLAEASMSAEEIDAVIVSTCTGYLCPGLSSYVAGNLGLRRDVCALDLVGQGCGAALPNLRAGEALLAGRRAARALSICVEVCSAAFYLDDDPGVLVSACLFGDAAGAAVLSDSVGRRSVQWLEADSSLDPNLRDLLRFESKGGMLRNILTPSVPLLAGKAAAALFE